MSEMCGWLVGLPAPAPACMCGVEGSRPQPLTQASALKETESGEARAALTIYIRKMFVLRHARTSPLEGASGVCTHEAHRKMCHLNPGDHAEAQR